MHRIAGWIALGLLIAGLPAQRLVKDIAVEPPGPDRTSAAPTGLMSAHGRGWFSAYGHWEAQPWVSDGTAVGTRCVGAIGAARWVVPVAGTDVVGAGMDGMLWRSDGTVGGTVTLRKFGLVAWEAGRIGNRALFFADDGLHGFEPWISDGTVAGTTLLVDARAGSGSGIPRFAPVFATFGSKALFLADDGVHGFEPWVTDGTTGGTRIVDIRAGASGSYYGTETARVLVPAGDRVYFAPDDGSRGLEPWVSDGTVAGTRLLADLNPGPASSVFFGTSQRRELAWGSALVFEASDGQTGVEPWISDGTSTGTRQLGDLWPGSSSSRPRQFFVLGNRFGFTAEHPTLGDELWISDGSSAGTVLLADILPGAGSSGPTVVAADGLLSGGKAMFRADDGVHGRELWVTDGTSAGTQLLADLQPGLGSSPEVRQAWSLGGLALFSTAVAVSGFEPWITDGTPAGTRMLRDVRGGFAGSLEPEGFVAVRAGSVLLFAADDGEHGIEPWVTDGTSAGTVLLRDIGRREPRGSDPAQVGTVLERIVLQADEPASGREPWVSDGTAAGTMLLRDFVPGPASGEWPAGSEAADHMLFAGKDAVTGREPWITDGTPAGTRMLREIASGAADGMLDGWMTPVGRLVFFEGSDAQHGRELWVTDGTTAGTRLVADIRPGPEGSGIRALQAFLPIALGDRWLFFSADDGVHGQEPWVSDGTPQGTQLVRDLRAGSEHGIAGFSAASPVTVGSRALFVGYDAAAGYDLFATDGTPAGTQLLADMDAQPSLALLAPARFPDGRVLLNSFKGIWVTDGTVAATRRVAGGLFGSAAAIGDRVLFAAKDLNGTELWITDGTPAGTHMWIDLWPGPGSSNPTSLVRSGDIVFFVADDGVHGAEPWVTDGTTNGTRMLADVCRGARGSSSYAIAAGDHRRALFVATSIQHGAELWVSDGTTAGTQLLSDLEPGPDGSYPRYLGRAGDVLYFSCLTSRYGRELYAVDLRTLGAAYSAPLGTGCAGTDARIPRLSTVGAPLVGSSGFAAMLSRARALAPASLMVGLGPGPQALAGPCSFYLGPHAAHIHSTITDGNGWSVITLGVPSTASLVGTKLHAQALVLDPQGAWLNLAAFSNGLTIVVGR